MRIFLTVLSVALAMAGLSCGGNAPPQIQQNTAVTGTPDAIVGGTTATPRSDSAPRSRDMGRLDGDAPPADARFTIFCDVFRGPDHVIRSTQLKDDLIQKTGMHAWHILHTEQQSMLCFGYYRIFDDSDHEPKETARAQADIKRVNAIKGPQGDRLFKLTLFVSIDEQDPESPAAWNLANAPANAYWSLQIGAYRASLERKQYAVDVVRAMRAAGIQAYYYHGDTISSVCVGAWPREAVKEQDASSAHTADPTATLLIVNQPLPQFASPDMRDREGNRLTVQAPKLEVTDPAMAKAIREYPDHAVNGEVHAIKTKDGQLIHDPSFLVVIPHGEGSPDPIAQQNNADSANGANRAASDIFDNPTPPKDAALGRLRSLGN
ncbi:MAG TPA: hypothetical protein VG326_09330 [Tepidisphaeraceae bacterium]|nr:hypothetical protein [Tepidisphaeraceae bacterium]